jgi:hypothetical protein
VVGVTLPVTLRLARTVTVCKRGRLVAAPKLVQNVQLVSVCVALSSPGFRLKIPWPQGLAGSNPAPGTLNSDHELGARTTSDPSTYFANCPPSVTGCTRTSADVTKAPSTAAPSPMEGDDADGTLASPESGDERPFSMAHADLISRGFLG